MVLVYQKLNNLLEKVDLGNKNKLDYYKEINGTELYDDIRYLEMEDFYQRSFCNKEQDYIEGRCPRRRVNTNITLNREKNFFAKLFIRDYLKNIGKRYDLCLPNNLSAAVVFKDFASDELKKDKEFVSTIVKLDGRYLPYMKDRFQKDHEMFKLALMTDTSMYMESFLKCNTEHRKDPSLALLFFERLISNNNNLSADTICRVFLAKGLLEKDSIFYDMDHYSAKKVDNASTQDKSTNVFVKINGRIEWIRGEKDDYIEKLADIFTKEEYESWIHSTKFLEGLISLNPRISAHVVNNLLPLASVVLNNDPNDNQKQDNTIDNQKPVVKVKR